MLNRSSMFSGHLEPGFFFFIVIDSLSCVGVLFQDFHVSRIRVLLLLHNT